MLWPLLPDILSIRFLAFWFFIGIWIFIPFDSMTQSLIQSDMWVKKCGLFR